MKKYPRAFAVTSKNKKILLNSSSGGVFFHIAKYFLENNGVVYGTTIENGRVFTKRVTDVCDLPLLMGSKYVYTDTMNTFVECEKDLKSNKKVFYISTPCIITSLHFFLKKKNVDSSALLTGDVFCFGAPNKKYWKLYLSEKYPGKNINIVKFREKKPSWVNYSLRINNKRIFAEKDEYFKAFLGRYSLMNMCFSCRHKGENRSSDFSIGDFWGIRRYYPELYDKHGVSLLIIRDNDWVIDLLSRVCNINEVDYSLAIANNPAYYLSGKKPDDYEEFEKNVEKTGFLNTVKRNPNLNKEQNPIKTVLKSSLRNLLLKRNKHLNTTSVNFKKYNSIGIITNDSYDLENKLENYALIQKLTKLGYKPVFISNDNYKRYRFGSFFSRVKETIKTISNSKFRKKKRLYKKLSKQIGEKTFFYSYSNKDKLKVNYFSRIIITGNNIWNWKSNNKIMFNLGALGSDYDGKIISLSSSFGINFIDDRCKILYSYALSSINSLGVRSEQDLEIIKNLGYKAIINPSVIFLLKKDEWNSSIQKYSNIKVPQKYIFVYLTKSTSKEKPNLFDFTKTNSLNIVNVNENGSYYHNNMHCFDFLNLLAHSDIVYTDSPFVILFSALFGKKTIITKKDSEVSNLEMISSQLSIKLYFDEINDFSKLDIEKIDNLAKIAKGFLLSNIQDSNNYENK